MPLTEKRKEWLNEKTVVITMRLQKSTDADILAFLEGKQKQTEIKKALRLLMEAESAKGDN